MDYGQHENECYYVGGDARNCRECALQPPYHGYKKKFWDGVGLQVFIFLIKKSRQCLPWICLSFLFFAFAVPIEGVTVCGCTRNQLNTQAQTFLRLDRHVAPTPSPIGVKTSKCLKSMWGNSLRDFKRRWLFFPFSAKGLFDFHLFIILQTLLSLSSTPTLVSAWGYVQKSI